MLRGSSVNALCTWWVCQRALDHTLPRSPGRVSLHGTQTLNTVKLLAFAFTQGMPIDSSVAELLTAQMFVLVQEAPDPIFFYINSTGIAVRWGPSICGL